MKDPNLQLVKPTPGARVRDPATGLVVPAEGIPVVVDTYWRRREADEEITISPYTPPKEPAAKAKEQ